MNLGDLLKSLALDTWYKATMYLGGVILAFSFFVDVKGITNAQLQLLAGGAFLVGLGEWKNHKVVSWFKPPNVYTGGPALMSAPVRQPDALGLLLDLTGCVLVVLGIVNIVRP